MTSSAAASDTGAASSLPTHGKPDHLERTAGEPREDYVADATIVEVREETPTVRELVLDVAGPFTFRAGNWVDFFIPDLEKVGGYSMCSLPAELPRLRLAVKRSSHPPAAWCHSAAAAPGACVQLKAGGDFYWDPVRDGPSTEHLLLVAGGLGINPLYAMAQEALAASAAGGDEAAADGSRLRRVTLLYSAGRPAELAFRGHLEELARQDPRLQLRLAATRPEAEDEWAGRTGRIDAAELRSALDEAAVPHEGVLAYVCGPPAMTDELVEVLRTELGLSEGRVRFEKWW